TAHRGRAALARHLGRETELKQINAAFASLRVGKRAVVQLEGSMGVGKSAMTQAVHRNAAGRGRNWLNVACPPYGQDLPYTTLAGLLRGLLQRLKHSESLEQILAASADAEGLDVGLAADVVRDLLAQSTQGVDDRASSLPAQL